MKRNTMNQAPVVDFDLEIAKSIAEQCICHPVSRSINDIERAGEAIKYLLWVIEQDRAHIDEQAAEIKWLKPPFRGVLVPSDKLAEMQAEIERLRADAAIKEDKK